MLIKHSLHFCELHYGDLGHSLIFNWPTKVRQNSWMPLPEPLGSTGPQLKTPNYTIHYSGSVCAVGRHYSQPHCGV